MLSLFRKKSELKRVDNVALLDKDIPLQSYSESKKFDTLADRIEDHPDNSQIEFSYAVVTKGPPFSRKALMQTLSGSLISYSEPIEERNIPVMHLSKGIEVIKLVSLTKFKSGNSSDKYVNLKQAIITFRPTVGFLTPFSRVSMRLVDRRFRDEEHQIQLSFDFGSNLQNSEAFGLDYSVPICDMDQISIEFVLSNSPLKEGFVWGTIRAQVCFRLSDEANTYGFVPVVAVVGFNETNVVKNRRNPKYANVEVGENSLAALREMHAKGQLRDMSKPEGQRKLGGNYAASVAGSTGSQDLVKAGLLKNWRQQVSNDKPDVIAEEPGDDANSTDQEMSFEGEAMVANDLSDKEESFEQPPLNSKTNLTHGQNLTSGSKERQRPLAAEGVARETKSDHAAKINDEDDLAASDISLDERLALAKQMSKNGPTKSAMKKADTAQGPKYKSLSGPRFNTS